MQIKIVSFVSNYPAKISAEITFDNLILWFKDPFFSIFFKRRERERDS